MSLLGRAEILATVAKPRIEKMPAFGGEVCVRGLTALERDQWESSLSDINRDKAKSWRASLVVYGLCDESGARLFTDEDTGVLAAASSEDVDLIFDKIRELSGMDKKSRERIEKN